MIILSPQTSATDVLKAMGAMPSGFRSTTLGKMTKEGKLLSISAPL